MFQMCEDMLNVFFLMVCCQRLNMHNISFLYINSSCWVMDLYLQINNVYQTYGKIFTWDIGFLYVIWTFKTRKQFNWNKRNHHGRVLCENAKYVKMKSSFPPCSLLNRRLSLVSTPETRTVNTSPFA